MSLIIYTTKDDIWIEKVKEYASFNNWSLSKAVRQILKAFVKVNMPEKLIIETTNQSEGYIKIDDEMPMVRLKAIKKAQPVEPEPDKIDLATFEAQNMAKLNVNQNMEACIKEHTISGEISCYMFDNAREYHPFCKKDCWTNKIIWKERVRL